MKYGKVWGETRPLLVTPLVEIHEIIINPNAHCSHHDHRHKHNAFYCVKGEVEVHVKKTNYDLEDVTFLSAGQITEVPPNEEHWFQTGSSAAIVLEIYYLTPLNPNDIDRKGTVGGVNETE